MCTPSAAAGSRWTPAAAGLEAWLIFGAAGFTQQFSSSVRVRVGPRGLGGRPARHGEGSARFTRVLPRVGDPVHLWVVLVAVLLAERRRVRPGHRRLVPALLRSAAPSRALAPLSALPHTRRVSGRTCCRYEGRCEIQLGVLQETSVGDGWDYYEVSFTARLYHNRTDIESPLAVIANEWGSEEVNGKWPGYDGPTGDGFQVTDEAGRERAAETYRRSVIDCCTSPGSGAVWEYTNSAACAATSAPKCNTSTLPEDYLFPGGGGGEWKGVHSFGCGNFTNIAEFSIESVEKRALYRFFGVWLENSEHVRSNRAVPGVLQPDGLQA